MSMNTEGIHSLSRHSQGNLFTILRSCGNLNEEAQVLLAGSRISARRRTNGLGVATGTTNYEARPEISLWN